MLANDGVIGARRIGLIYSDEKFAAPRQPMTIVDNLYSRMAKTGVSFAITTGNPSDCEFPTLWFSKREAVAHE